MTTYLITTPYCTFFPVNCSAPSTASGVEIEPYSKTTEGAVIHFSCVGSERIMAVCGSAGRWNPDPGVFHCPTGNDLHVCTYICEPVCVAVGKGRGDSHHLTRDVCCLNL